MEPEGESQEVGCESKNGEGGDVEENPVCGRAEGDVAELIDLEQGKRKREKRGPQEIERKPGGGHGKKKDKREEDEDMMKRHDAFPAEAGEERDTAVFLILREGLEIERDEISEGEEGQRDGEDEEWMCR